MPTWPRNSNTHAFARMCQRFANGSTDARECPVREEGRHRLCDGQSAQGAQRPEYADLEGSANRLRGCAGRRHSARRHPDGRRQQGVHRRRRHQRARACHGVRSRAVQPLRTGGARSHRESRQAGDRGRQWLCARRRLRDGDGLHHQDRGGHREIRPARSRRSDSFRAAAERNGCRGWSARAAPCSSFCPER